MKIPRITAALLCVYMLYMFYMMSISRRITSRVPEWSIRNAECWTARHIHSIPDDLRHMQTSLKSLQKRRCSAFCVCVFLCACVRVLRFKTGFGLQSVLKFVVYFRTVIIYAARFDRNRAILEVKSLVTRDIVQHFARFTRMSLGLHTKDTRRAPHAPHPYNHEIESQSVAAAAAGGKVLGNNPTCDTARIRSFITSHKRGASHAVYCINIYEIDMLAREIAHTSTLSRAVAVNGGRIRTQFVHIIIAHCTQRELYNNM